MYYLLYLYGIRSSTSTDSSSDTSCSASSSTSLGTSSGTNRHVFEKMHQNTDRAFFQKSVLSVLVVVAAVVPAVATSKLLFVLIVC